MARHNRKSLAGWIALLVIAVAIIVGGAIFTSLFDTLLPDNSTQPVATSTIIKQLQTSVLSSGQWVNQAEGVNVETADQSQIVPNQADVPMPPTRVEAVDAEIGNQVFISWAAPLGQLYDGVTLERDITSAFSNPVIVADQLPATGEWVDRDVENLQTYYYRLQSYRTSPAVRSVYTEAVTVIPHDNIAPAPIRITQIQNIPADQLPTGSKAGVTLRWEAGSEDVAEYRIYRSTVEGTLGTQITKTTSAMLETQDTTVEPGVIYYYVVTAVDAAQNESATTITVPQVGNLVPFVAESSDTNANGN